MIKLKFRSVYRRWLILKKDYLKIDNINLKSRLIVGTGKYKSLSETAKAVKASGANMVTVAVRRVNVFR